MIHLKPLPCSPLFFSVSSKSTITVDGSYKYLSFYFSLEPIPNPNREISDLQFFFISFFLYARKFGKPVYEHDMYS